jgi:hypothetical protein
VLEEMARHLLEPTNKGEAQIVVATNQQP